MQMANLNFMTIKPLCVGVRTNRAEVLKRVQKFTTSSMWKPFALGASIAAIIGSSVFADVTNTEVNIQFTGSNGSVFSSGYRPVGAGVEYNNSGIAIIDIDPNNFSVSITMNGSSAACVFDMTFRNLPDGELGEFTGAAVVSTTSAPYTTSDFSAPPPSGKTLTLRGADCSSLNIIPSGTTVFSFTSTTSAPVVTDGNISISGASGTSGAYKVGDTVTARWDDTVATGDANPDTQSVTFNFSQFGGPAAVPGTNNSGIWTASHTITEGSIDLTTRNVSVTATDDDAPTPLSTTTADTTNAVVDNEPPVVTDVNLSVTGASGTGGAFIIGDTVTATWNNTAGGDNNADISSVTVDFSQFGGGSSVTATNSSGTWTATYNITAGAIDATNRNITITATDNAGNTTSRSDTSNNTLDNIAPTLTDTHISVAGASGTSGVFIAGDTVTANWNNTVSGDNNSDTITGVTFDFSAFGGSSAVSAVNSSGTWTAEYLLPTGSITTTNLNVSATATDNAGNTTTTADTTNSSVDNNVPGQPAAPTLDASSNTGDATDNITSDATATISGTTEANAVVEVFIDGISQGTVTADGNGAWTFVFSLGQLSNGSNSITTTSTDVNGNTSAASAALVLTLDTVAPTVTLTGPAENVTSVFDVQISFNEPVTGFAIGDVTVTNGTVTALSGAGASYTATVDPVPGTIIQISVLANVAFDISDNGNTASNVLNIQFATPRTLFEEYREEIRQVLVDEAERSLRSGLSANQRMVRGARSRFVAAQRERAECSEDDTGSSNEETCDVGLVSRNNVPFDVDGTFALNGTTLSTSGEFFQQTGNYEGTQRRLFFGDFDVQHDGDTGSTTATLTGRMAWEQMVSDRTMLGYFIGGELAHSNIDGAFEGDQDRVGVTAGGYAVHQLADQVYLDGFLSYGIGRNNLDMKNDVLALTSDYTTRTATAGAALSGVYEYERYEFRPELAFSYGHTWIGNVGFTGRAYGLVDDTLSLDAGNVSIANLTLRPEVVWALDADTVADSRSQISFAPRAICERTMSTRRVEDCGGGAELGLSSTSEDGLSNAEIRFVRDRVGNSYRSSFAVNIEHRF